MLSYWLYISTVGIHPNSAEEALIFRIAKERNRDLGVTGYLHRENGYFVQYIEGSEDVLEKIKNMIRADWRHSNVRDLETGVTLTRRFDGWDMVFSNEETNAFRDWQSSRGSIPDISSAPAADILGFMLDTTGCGRLETI